MFRDFNIQWLDQFEKKDTIAIIGNSPNILSESDGAYIEEFDIICRLNSFTTSGFEKYIGKRTDIYVTCLIDNPSKTKNQLLKDGIKTAFVTRPISKKYAYNSALGLMLSNYHTISSFNPVFVTEKDFSELYDLLMIKESMPGVNPSSGLTFLYVLLKYYTFEKVFVKGFDFFDSENIRMHYFDNDVYDKKENIGLIQKFHPRNSEIKLFKSILTNNSNVILAQSTRKYF